jgi:hypothetical protein
MSAQADCIDSAVQNAGVSSQAILAGVNVMILGMSFSAFTWLHVVLSLIGIASGIIVLFGMLGGKSVKGLTGLFLATTVLTSVTGFMFPFAGLGPSHIVGLISLAVLAAAVLALYIYRLAGAWRWIYVAGAVIALYLNVFVGVVQAFQKLSLLQPLAPTQSEPPFIAAQLAVLAIFAIVGIAAVRSFHPERPAGGAPAG